MAIQEDELHGDVLETVLTHVPLVHLASAAAVSKSWNDAVLFSLRYMNKPRPWLILHKQSTRAPYSASTHAYDPRSRIWIKISSPPTDYISDLSSSNSNFISMLTASRLRFSSDVLNFDWQDLDPPLVWRCDAIVAQVADCIIVAGGGWDFEDDPLAVEIYDLKSRSRSDCGSMPDSFRESGTLMSLSVAVACEKLIITNKEIGLTHWFDPKTRLWSRSFHLDPGVHVSRYLIGYTIHGLILLGVFGDDRVKVWSVDLNNLNCDYEIGEMPKEYAEKLRSQNFGYSSLNITAAGSMIYAYNDTWDVEEVVACELLPDGGCGWWSVRHVTAREELMGARLIYTCSDVGIEDLHRLMGTAKETFQIKMN